MVLAVTNTSPTTILQIGTVVTALRLHALVLLPQYFIGYYYKL